jgi:hypothetical protein
MDLCTAAKQSGATAFWVICAFAIPAAFLFTVSLFLLAAGTPLDFDVASVVFSMWSLTLLMVSLLLSGSIGDLLLQFSHWATLAVLLCVQSCVFPIAPTPHERPPPSTQGVDSGRGVNVWRLPKGAIDKTR